MSGTDDYCPKCGSQDHNCRCSGKCPCRQCRHLRDERNDWGFPKDIAVKVHCEFCLKSRCAHAINHVNPCEG